MIKSFCCSPGDSSLPFSFSPIFMFVPHTDSDWRFMPCGLSSVFVSCLSAHTGSAPDRSGCGPIDPPFFSTPQPHLIITSVIIQLWLSSLQHK